MPRPRKLCETKQYEVCALIHSGCTLAAAARYVGCSPLTIQREAHRNQEFHDKLRKAQLNTEITPVRTLRDAAVSDWRAAAWILERTQPQQYAKRTAGSFSPQEVAELLDRVCDIVRQEVRDAQKAARIKRRVLVLARTQTIRQEDSPFKTRLPAATSPTDSAPATPSDATAAAPCPPPVPATNIHRPARNIERSELNDAPSKCNHNSTDTKPVLICAADALREKSRPVAPAHSS
jgi:hypothetical protein